MCSSSASGTTGITQNAGEPNFIRPLQLTLARKITRQYVVECDGQPVGDVKEGFSTIAVDAGLYEPIAGKDADGNPTAVKKPTIHPHTLRHTCVTWLLWDGLDFWKVGGFVGMSPDTVRDVYGHHHPDYMAEAGNSALGRDAGTKTGLRCVVPSDKRTITA
ncbi:hypothetical protein [Azospirillum rugosum]|uniref:Integrase n=1 Tax=Azospirillum rugosum TaxID=416170 RepID=A0ABS4SKA4_9PROT|nr:hypothetical protein [Azospirillum rugosum]MBP2292994.1 integrase [Azospirillum rugosum]MDQ0526543.1 integrase [Azospirillum rugosum]